MSGAQLPLFERWTVRERVSPRARRIRVDVRPDGEVVLTIPKRGSREAALRFLEQSRAWVERTRTRLLRRGGAAAPATLRWDGSDRIPLRGVATPLRVELATGRRATCEHAEDALRLRVPASWRWDPARLKRLLARSLREQAAREGRALLEAESRRLGVAYRSLSIRDTRSRWGSCGADGRIMLSVRLLLAPPEVFRYVVVHELCHLRWRGHGPRFWSLVARQLPEFEAARDWLRRRGAALQAVPL